MKIKLSILLFILFFSTMGSSVSAETYLPYNCASTRNVPIIDGIISESEWANFQSIDLNYWITYKGGYSAGAIPWDTTTKHAEISLMASSTQLFICLKIPDDFLGPEYPRRILQIYLDDYQSGYLDRRGLILENYDNINKGYPTISTILDGIAYRNGADGGSDTTLGGTMDTIVNYSHTSGGVSATEGTYIFEFDFPLASATNDVNDAHSTDLDVKISYSEWTKDYEQSTYWRSFISIAGTSFNEGIIDTAPLSSTLNPQGKEKSSGYAITNLAGYGYYNYLLVRPLSSDIWKLNVTLATNPSIQVTIYVSELGVTPSNWDQYWATVPHASGFGGVELVTYLNSSKRYEILVRGSRTMQFSGTVEETWRPYVLNGDFEEGGYPIPGWTAGGHIGHGSGPTTFNRTRVVGLVQFEHGSSMYQDVYLDRKDLVYSFWYRPYPKGTSIEFKALIDGIPILTETYQGVDDDYNWRNYILFIEPFLNQNGLSTGTHRVEFLISPSSSSEASVEIDEVTFVKSSFGSLSVTPMLIVDLSSVSDDRCNVGSFQSVRFHARWDNGSNVASGSIKINDYNIQFNNLGWAQLTDTSSVVVKKDYLVKSVNCSGVTDFAQVVASPSIIWDRVALSLSIADERIDVGTPVDYDLTGTYEYDGRIFKGKMNYNVTCSPSESSSVRKGTYKVLSIEDENYGLTSFTCDEVACVWDRVKITEGGVSKPLTSTGSMETVWFKAVYEYDNSTFSGEPTTNGGMNKLFVNGVPLQWSSFDKVWKYTTKLDDNGKMTFEVTGVEDMQYKLITFIDTAGPQTITWEKPFFETPIGIVSVAAVLAVFVACAVFFLRNRVK